MMQLELELEWLSDTWNPKPEEVHHVPKVRKYENIGMSPEEFEDSWAQSLGYNNINHLNKHNYLKDMECLARYGNNCKRNR